MKYHEKNLYSRAFGNRYFMAALSFCLIFIFMGMLLERIARDFDQAEQAQFDLRLSELQAAVRLMEADLISQGNLHTAHQYEGKNPMDWFKDDVSYYVGALKPRDAIQYPGNWFFDEQASAIAFVPYGMTDLDEPENVTRSLDKILRFKVRALRSKDIQPKYSGLALQKINHQKHVGQYHALEVENE